MFHRERHRQEEDGKAELLRFKLEQAEAVVVGAGAGLSASAGYDYAGERFRKYFSDFADIYHFTDMYTGGFYPYDSPEEYWAYWSRYIYINRYLDPPGPVYKELYALVKDKDYFVLTTNVDHCFQRAGFDKERLFYTQGDFGLFQCQEPCHPKTYDNEPAVRRMVEEQKDRRIPSELLPHCPVCGGPMSMNLRSDNTFVEDEGWHRAAGRYSVYLEGHRCRKVLFLELGIGYNTPGIVKYSFWQMTKEWPDASYACINLDGEYVPDDIRERSICINGDIGSILERISRPNL